MSRALVPVLALALLAAAGGEAYWRDRGTMPPLPLEVRVALPPAIAVPPARPAPLPAKIAPPAAVLRAAPLSEAAAAPGLARPPNGLEAGLPAATVPALQTVVVAAHPIHAPPPGLPDHPVPLPEIAPRPLPRDGAAAPTTISGRAEVTGDITLAILGHAVRLFGVRPPAPHDRCMAASGAIEPCTEVARAALAARLASRPSVTCTAPPLAPADAGLICRDSTGLDLAGFLVGQGLVLADASGSHDYLGAEQVSRSYHRGLWAAR